MNDAGKVAFLPRGEYADFDTYEILDFVSDEEGAYVSKKIKQTGVATTVESAWQPLLIKPDPENVKKRIDRKSITLDADGHICVNPLYIPWGSGVIHETEYTIAYNFNGGEAPSRIYPSTYYNTKTTAIPNQYKDGYIFDGWTGSHLQELTKNYVIPKKTNLSMTLEAQYHAGTNYTISYNLNGGMFEREPAYQYTSGSYYNPPIPVREGYIFTGWDVAGIRRSDTGNKTLTANWIQKNAANPCVVFYPYALIDMCSLDLGYEVATYPYIKYSNTLYKADRYYTTPRDLYMDCRGVTNNGYGDHNRAGADPIRISVSKNGDIEIYNTYNQKMNCRLGKAYWDGNNSDWRDRSITNPSDPLIIHTSGTILVTCEYSYYYSELRIIGLEDEDVSITQVT